MADVVNALNGMTPTRSDSGSGIPPESPDSVILSPSIKEAMDRILPKSATQLLQPISYEQNHLQNSPFANKLSSPFSPMPDSVYPTKASGLYTPTIENSPANQLNNTSPANSCDNLEVPSKDSSSKKRPTDKLRISRADMEIITSSADLIDNDNVAETSSDPEDMTRCFSGVYREKRKQKKKRKRAKTSPERKGAATRDYSSQSDDDVSQQRFSSVGCGEPNSKAHPLGSRNNESSSVIDTSFDSKLSNGLHVESRNCMNDCQNSIAIGRDLPKNSFTNDCAIGNEDVSNISTSSSKENVVSQRKHSGQKLPRTKRLEYHIVKHKGKIKMTFLPAFVVLKKCNSLTSQKVSNGCFDLKSDALPLSARVKHLMVLCNSGHVDCRKRKQKGVIIVDEPVYKNIFEENVLLGLSDEESEGSYGRRSLRKRVKNISYVEPSEDDIIEDFSRKRSRSKAKDAGSGCDTDTSQDNKRRKTNDKPETYNKLSDILPDKVVVVDKPPDKPSHSSGGDQVLDQVASEKEITIQDKPSKTPSIQEIIVFPPTPIVKQPEFALALAKTKAQAVGGSAEKEKKSLKGRRNKVKAAVPSQLPPGTMNTLLTYSSPPVNSSRISVFSTPPRPDLFLSGPPASVPMFSSLPGFPSVMTTMSTQANLSQFNVQPYNSQPFPQPVQKQQQPQYCIMKVDGKDVLLQLVPSGNVGASVMMPGGKKMIVRPTVPPLSSPMLMSPPMGPLASTCTQAITAPVTLPAVQNNAAMTAAFPNLFGVPVLNRHPNSTASNTPMSGLPVISFSNAGGFTTPVTTRPAFTSGMCLAPPPLPTAVPFATTVPLIPMIPTPSITRFTSSAVRMTASTSTVSTSSVSAMPAPAPKVVKTVADLIRSTARPALRAVVPNQTSSLRAIRIFVPGCTTTGTPGRFATLGSVANSSPLTRLSASSDLLPQRKQSSDQEITPEQKAARRRKLEKKYPLPPGVVIKTEPLESFPATSAVTTVRSLLSSNIQLVSSVTRPGTTVRIIAPSIASTQSSTGIRGNHNIIYRAAKKGTYTVLVPTTVGQLTSVVPTSSSTVATQAATSASASPHTTVTVTTTATPLDTTKQSVPAVFVSPSSKSAHNPIPSPAIWSPAASLSDKSAPVSGQPSSPATSLNTSQQASSEKPLTEESVEEFKISVVKLRELVQKQESLGLKGERMEKLKELLLKKEAELEKMKRQLEIERSSPIVISHGGADCDTESTSALGDKGNSNAEVNTDTGSETEDAPPGHPVLGTESDPFIVD